MINSLHIKNIGIIDDICIDFNEGFNVLTGETGAGKTLIIDSLQILAGGRFSKEMIRSGEEISFVEASIYFPNDIYDDDNIIVSREINVSGKNLCKINGRLVSVSELKEFMKNVIDIHGQNDNQSILDEETHIELLDGFAKKEIDEPKALYSSLYEKYMNIKKELDRNYGDDIERQRKLDLLNYQFSEIEDAELKEGEEDELLEKKKLISSSEKISQALDYAKENLSGTSLDSLTESIRAMEKIEEFSPKYKEVLERLRSSYYELEEASRDVETFADSVEFNEEELDEIQKRLDIIKSLKRKYGNSIEEILKYKNEVEKQIYEITNLDSYIHDLKKKQAAIVEELYEAAKKLHSVREKYSKDLSNKINKELKELEMKNAKFSVNIIFDEDKIFKSDGLDTVEFMISTNVGEDEKKLTKIASGGEMSRFMLAIKNVLTDVDKIPVLIFDEIDTGISGVAAKVTGEKIKKISKHHQVLCVTHLASIAAKGDYNYFISKKVENGKTRTQVELLDEEKTLREIARISSGNITEISIKLAKELRNSRVREIA